MTKAELRLEILKICFRRDQTADIILDEAKKFEAYVSEPVAETKPIDREPLKAGRTVGKTTP